MSTIIYIYSIFVSGLSDAISKRLDNDKEDINCITLPLPHCRIAIGLNIEYFLNC